MTGALLVAILAATADPKAIETLATSGKLDEAIEAGRAAVAERPDDVDLRVALARALATKGRRLERVVQIPGSPSEFSGTDLRLKLTDFGDGKLQAGYDAALFEEAVLNLGEAVMREPKRKDLRMYQVYLLTDGARVDRAASALREAIGVLPKEPGLPSELARFGAERTKRGDPAGGAKLLGIVVDAFPKEPSLRADHGVSLARLGKKEEALSELDEAVKLQPKDLRFLRARATAAMVLREFRRAQAAYDAAYGVSRQEVDRLGSAVAAYGVDPKASQGAFEELAARTPSAQPALVDLAGKFAEAAKDGAGSQSAANLAKSIRHMKQDLLAIPVLDARLRANPKDQASRDALGEIYVALGAPILAMDVRKGK